MMNIILYTLLSVQVTIACVTLYMHRSQAHRSVEFHPALAHAMRFWLWLTTGMVTKQWVAIHRKHHRFVDEFGDPHSPVRRGIWRVLFLGAFLYAKEAKNQKTVDTYGVNTPTDWIERNLYSRYPWLGIVLLFNVNLFLYSYWGLAAWAVQMLWIPFWAAGFINGVGHWWGYRNTNTRDSSRNIVPWAFWIGGEELHNNHHAQPASAKLSMRPWEFDIGWLYIRLLSLVRLAKVRPPGPVKTD
jgi:stearoyl-CoA desaturase (delta-9 desaturase)